MPKLPPQTEAELYNSATLTKPVTETSKTVLPITKEGMQARKRALRELRCFPAPKGGEAAVPAKKVTKKKAPKKKVAKKDK